MILDELTATRDNRHAIAKAWKEEHGGKVVGVFCCNVPEEMLHAAGMLPVRMMGEHEEMTEADLHFPSNVCPYPKGCFDQALKGAYDYLDGLVVPNNCDMIRAQYGFWRRNVGLPFAYFLEVPQKASGEGTTYFAAVLRRFAAALLEFGGVEVTKQSLRDSIRVHNRNRALLRRLDAVKRRNPSIVSGSRMQDAVLSSMLMPKEIHNDMLSRALEELEGGSESRLDGVRIFISASMLDDSDFLRLVEECGGIVIADDMPTGTRYFQHDVAKDTDPFEALADRYLNKIACPRKVAPEERFEFVERMMQGAEVQGAIVHVLRACDCHLYEFPYLRERLEAKGLPVLFFRGEETEAEREQQKTEIEAFFEMIGG